MRIFKGDRVLWVTGNALATATWTGKVVGFTMTHLQVELEREWGGETGKIVSVPRKIAVKLQPAIR